MPLFFVGATEVVKNGVLMRISEAKKRGYLTTLSI
jgi:hypothetical protein